MFELRATTSLAQLWLKQGRSAESRELLARAYGWFTEGIECPTLRMRRRCSRRHRAEHPPDSAAEPAVFFRRGERHRPGGLQCKGSAKTLFLVCLHDLRSRARIVTGVLGEATIRELEIGLTGSVVGPGDPSYETARRVWNHAIDKQPALIVRAASTGDVVRAVGFARSEGRPIAIRGGAPQRCRLFHL